MSAATARISARPTVAYRFGHSLCRIVVGGIFRMRWLHRDRIPAGGIVLVANHVSYIDPFAVGLALPTGRPIHYMAKLELFRVPVLGPFLYAAGMIPVNRGHADRGAIREATDVLSAGGVLGIFPEGTRVRAGKTSQPEEGAAFLATRGGALIVPAGISGTERIWPAGQRFPRFPRVTVVFGEPIDPAAYAQLPKGERMRAITDAVMAAIHAAKADADRAARGEAA